MISGGTLDVRQIVWIDIPLKGMHPAVVVLRLANGYVVVNGTGTPQDREPTTILSEPLAKRVGLHKETKFYCHGDFVWYWRPSPVPIHVGFMPGSNFLDVRSGAMATLQAMQSLGVELRKLPPESGITLPDLKRLTEIISAEKGPQAQ